MNTTNQYTFNISGVARPDTTTMQMLEAFHTDDLPGLPQAPGEGRPVIPQATEIDSDENDFFAPDTVLDDAGVVFASIDFALSCHRFNDGQTGIVEVYAQHGDRWNDPWFGVNTRNVKG